MLYTNYVWTELGQELAERSVIKESRIAGFPAIFAYNPCEKHWGICDSWLEAGYIKRVDEKLPFLQFYWSDKDTCASYHMIKMFNENNIKWQNGHFGVLEAAIGDNGEMVPVEYYHVAGNLYGIIVKPESTTRYFGITPEELHTENSDGYTREEALLCDNNIHAKPFAKDLFHAIRKAADYVGLGCDGVKILQCLNGKYAVVCH